MKCPKCKKSYIMCVSNHPQEPYEKYQCQNKDCLEVYKVKDGSVEYGEEDNTTNLSDF